MDVCELILKSWLEPQQASRNADVSLDNPPIAQQKHIPKRILPDTPPGLLATADEPSLLNPPGPTENDKKNIFNILL